MTPQPSTEALALAVKLSGHNACRVAIGGLPTRLTVCADCFANAATIDRELQVPQKNAALLLAQGVCDTRGRRKNTLGPINELRDALAAIRKIAD